MKHSQKEIVIGNAVIIAINALFGIALVYGSWGEWPTNHEWWQIASISLAGWSLYVIRDNLWPIK